MHGEFDLAFESASVFLTSLWKEQEDVQQNRREFNETFELSSVPITPVAKFPKRGARP